MGYLRPATPGFVVTLVATLLLTIVSLCVPYNKSVFFLRASISQGGVTGSVTLGTLGYCLELSNGTLCSVPSVGYELDINSLVGNNLPLQIPQIVVKWVTGALVLHIVALIIAAASALFGLLAHVREMSTTYCSTFVSGLAAVIALIAFIFDLVLFFVAKARISSVGSAQIGSAIWLTFAAWVLLFFSGCFYSWGRSCRSGRSNNNGYAKPPPKEVEGGLPMMPGNPKTHEEVHEDQIVLGRSATYQQCYYNGQNPNLPENTYSYPQSQPQSSVSGPCPQITYSSQITYLPPHPGVPSTYPPPPPPHPGVQSTYPPPPPPHPGVQSTYSSPPPPPPHPGAQSTYPPPLHPGVQSTYPSAPPPHPGVRSTYPPPPPPHPGVQSTYPSAPPPHPGVQSTYPSAPPPHLGVQSTYLSAPPPHLGVQSTYSSPPPPPPPPHPGAQSTYPPPLHPGVQSTYPPPLHPGVQSTYSPPPPHPGVQSTYAQSTYLATRSPPQPSGPSHQQLIYVPSGDTAYHNNFSQVPTATAMPDGTSYVSAIGPGQGLNNEQHNRSPPSPHDHSYSLLDQLSTTYSSIPPNQHIPNESTLNQLANPYEAIPPSPPPQQNHQSKSYTHEPFYVHDAPDDSDYIPRGVDQVRKSPDDLPPVYTSFQN